MIDLLKHQSLFIESKAPFTAIVGGYGSGKTEGGLIKLLHYLIRNKVDVAYYLPTYNLVEDIALKKLPKIFEKFDGFFNKGIDMKKKPYNIKTQYGDIMLRSMDNPDLIAGYEVGYSVIDEIDRMSLRRAEESFNSINARNRLPMPYDTNAIDFVCTPEGFSFLYNFFVKNGNDNRVLIKAKTTDNPYLPEDYIKRLTESYDEQRLRAYLNGEFVNFNNLNVYPLFDRNNHVKPFNDNIYKTYVGIDFNIGKMAGVVATEVNGVLHIMKEYHNYYDTEALIIEITKNHGRCFVFPDASGGNRSTSGNTDFEIIWDYKHEIINFKSNPFVKDRINAVNKRFRENRILIDPSCVNLITALEQQVLMENGQPDKTSGHDHILDALGYMIYGHFIYL